MAEQHGHGEGRPPNGPEWVHVGTFDVYVDAESGRMATRPAPARETARAEELAAALEEIRREPQKAVAAIEQSVAGVKAATDFAEKLVALARDLANLTDPAIAAKRAEEIVARILEDYREGRFRDVVLLVGAVLNIYLLAERWRALVGLLQLDRLAAEELGDLAEAAGALSDLGMLAEAAGDASLAGELHEQVSDMFEQGGEHVAAEATARAVSLAPEGAAHGGVALGVKVAAAVVGTVVLAGAATGFVVGDGVWFNVDGNDAEEVRAGGDAEIVAFAAGDSEEALGSEAESIAIPEGTVEPGEALGACNPTYVYHYVRFAGMPAGTTYTGTITPSSGESRTATNTSGRLAEFTEAFSLERGSEPHPYGEWTLVVEIEGVEVDRASFTLEEDCDAD